MLIVPLHASADNGAGAPAVSTEPSGTAQDTRIKALEEQMRQLQEQNRQTMEILKTMLERQQASTAPHQPTEVPQQVPAEKSIVEQSPAEKFNPGWLACIMSTKTASDNRRAECELADQLGCFIATKESYKYTEYLQIPNMPKDPKVGWKGEAFFETNEQGLHSFIIKIAFAFTSNFSYRVKFSSGFTLEGKEIFQTVKEFDREDDLCDPDKKKGDVCGSFTGSANLDPGRYKVEFWIYPASFGGFKDASLQVFTKKPSDLLPVPASQSMMVRSKK